MFRICGQINFVFVGKTFQYLAGFYIASLKKKDEVENSRQYLHRLNLP